MALPSFVELQDEALSQTFVGREAELRLIASAFDAVLTDPSAIRLFLVHGGGGIGKTALRRMAVRAARKRGLRVIEYDCSIDDANRGGALPDLFGELAVARDASASPSPTFVALDGFERAAFDDTGSRRRLFATLQPGTVTLVGMRNDPSTGWRAEPGWGSLVIPIALEPLTFDDTRGYLEKRGVAAQAREHIATFARGNPLVLVLLADAQLRSADSVLRIAQSPDLLSALCQELVRSVPDADHGVALEVATLLRVTTESTLATLVSKARARDLFRWLCELSFMETSSHGIYPHDLAREIIDRTFAWRDPEGRAALLKRARAFLAARLPARASGGGEVYATFAELGHLVPVESEARALISLPADFAGTHAPARDEHLGDIVAMTARHEGDASARLVARWHALVPHAFRVLLSPD